MSHRAFSDRYDYYRLKKSCLGLKEGAIFYHDWEDQQLGSISSGCLKLAWDADGNCDFGPCANTYVLHATAINDKEYLQKIDIKEENAFLTILIDKLDQWLKCSEDNKENNSPNAKISSYYEGESCAYRKIINYIKTLSDERNK